LQIQAFCFERLSVKRYTYKDIVKSKFNSFSYQRTNSKRYIKRLKVKNMV